MPPLKPHHNPVRRGREEDDDDSKREKQKPLAAKNSKNTFVATTTSNNKQLPQKEIIVVSSSDEDDGDDDESDEESDIYYTSTDENVENTYLAEEEEEEEEDDEWDDHCDDNYGDDDDLSSCDTDEDDSLPAFVMLFGIPGSGKSTWCRKFMNLLDARNARVRAEIEKRNQEKKKNSKNKKEQDNDGGKKKAPKNSKKESEELKIHEFKIISSDDVRREFAGTVNNQSRNGAVWDEVLSRVQKSLKRGVNTILDATNVDTSNRIAFISKLPPCRLKLQSFSCVDEHTAQRRIERDLERGVDRSAVPEKVVSRMRAQLNESIPNLRDEGWTVFNEGKYLN